MDRIDPVDLLKRLRVLENKLWNEGRYVSAETAGRAINFVLQTMGDEVAREVEKELFK